MNYFEEALKLANNQASVRLMTDDDILAMVESLATGLKALHEKIESVEVVEPVEAVEERVEAPSISPADVKKSIKASAIVCLECGKSFKVLGKRHLASHGLTPNSYRAKYGMKKNTPLCSKDFLKNSRERMANLRIWERKSKKEDAAE